MKILFEKYKTLLIGGLALCIGFFLFVSGPGNEKASGVASPVPVPEEREAVREEEAEKEPLPVPDLYVDVKGAVMKPGMYSMKEGDRIYDAISAAGGLEGNADEKRINHAQKLLDEMVVYIPAIGEEIAETELPPAPDESGGQDSKEGKVDINRADAAALETLPGIGPAKAKAIIDYREKNGPFKEIGEIQNVSGIGAKSFEKLEESIVVR